MKWIANKVVSKGNISSFFKIKCLMQSHNFAVLIFVTSLLAKDKKDKGVN